MHFGVEQVPQFRTLRLGVPLPEFIAKGKYPLFGPGLFLVAPRPPYTCIEAEFLDRFQQGGGLRGIARIACLAQCHRAPRSEEHTSELQSLMRISYSFFCFKKKQI